MRAFQDRRNAFEAHFALQMQDQFARQVRAARLAGVWAADAMGLAAEDARTYAASVVDALVVHCTADPVFDKIHADMEARGVTHTPQWLKRQLSTLPSA